MFGEGEWGLGHAAYEKYSTLERLYNPYFFVVFL